MSPQLGDFTAYSPAPGTILLGASICSPCPRHMPAHVAPGPLIYHQGRQSQPLACVICLAPGQRRLAARERGVCARRRRSERQVASPGDSAAQSRQVRSGKQMMFVDLELNPTLNLTRGRRRWEEGETASLLIQSSVMYEFRPI